MDEFVQAAVDLKAANPEPGELLRLLVPRPGLAQRRGVRLERRRRPRRRRTATSWQGDLSSARVDRGPGDRPDADRAGLGRGQGRQRGRPVDAVLRRRGRHDVDAGLGQGPDRGPRRRLPRHDRKNVGVFALPGTDGSPAPVLLGGSDIAISAKSTNQDLAQKAVALMLSDDYQTLMAAAGLTPAKKSLAHGARQRRVRARPPSRRRPTPSSPRPRRAGPRSRAPGCSRTCSSTSPRAATSRSSPAAADEKITDELSG